MNSIYAIANCSVVFLQNKLIDSMSDLSKRVIAVALVALSCITALYFMIQCCNWVFNEEDGMGGGAISFKLFSLSEEEPEISEPEQIIDISTPELETQAVEAIQAKWLDDPEQEANRVLKKSLIPKKLKLTCLDSNHEKYAVMGRVLEIKRLYQHTHYVFTHGQASQISMVNTFVKECTRLFSPQHYHPLNDAFRLPHTITYSKNANDFIQTFKATDPGFVDDGHHSDKMISVDAQFTNQEAMESAFYFFSRNSNIAFKSYEELKKIFNSIFSNYMPNKTICDMLAQKATMIAIQRQKESKIGVLHAICIPKATIQNDETNFAYPCHAFGKTCKCFPESMRIEKLEQMQKDKVVLCAGGHLTQYRILTSKLAEEKGVRSFAIDALPKYKVKSYQQQAEALVKELNDYSLLSDLIDQVDEDPTVIEQITSLREAAPHLEEKYVQLLFDDAKNSVPKTDYQEPWMVV